MKLELGMTLWLYTARNGEFKIYEGKVGTWNRRGRFPRMIVRFTDRLHYLCPDEEDIGCILPHGPRLWLTERDDAKAKQMFLEYEEGKLRELEKQVEKRRELIRMLKEDVE